MGSKTLWVMLAVCLVPTAALAQDRHAFVEGSGGLRLSSGPGLSGSVAGMAGGALTPYMEAVGEVGWSNNVLPGLLDTVVALTPATYRVSSFYGLGGIRLLSSPQGPVSVYGETLAGVTRLSNRFGGIGSPTTGLITNTALRFVDTTDPIAAVGAGVLFRAGPFEASAGYRFTRIFANDALAALVTGGNLDVNEVRVGMGVRF